MHSSHPVNPKPSSPPVTNKPVKHVTFQLPTDHLISGIRRKDIVVICAIWTFEAFYKSFQNWKNHSFLKSLPKNSWTSKDLYRHLAESVEVMVFTCLSMIAMGALTSFFRAYNFLLLIFGLAIFSSGPIFFALSLASNSYALGNAAVLTDIGWHLVDPLRYWLIMHQKFPLQISVSRQLTTVNECLITIVDYISSFYTTIHWSANYFHLQLGLGFIEFFVILWLIFVSAVMPWRNKVSNDVEAIKRVYERSEVFESFERRQNNMNSVIFHGLALSFAMFSLTKEAIQLGTKGSNRTDPEFADYRLDLACAFVSMTCIEAILILCDKCRVETFDLIVIGFAHLIITAVLGLLFVVVHANTMENHEFATNHRLHHETAIIRTSMCLYGAAYGASLVSQKHFIWIQSPIRCRTLLLAIYLSTNHLVAWSYRTFTEKYEFTQAIIVLMTQIFITFWHFSLSFIFAKRLWQQLSNSEKRMKNRRL